MRNNTTIRHWSIVTTAATGLTRLVYVVVGVAGLYHALQWKAIHFRWVGHERVTADLAGLQSTAAD
jgi:uncharacterized membrane protein YuzA (DUF378 family)